MEKKEMKKMLELKKKAVSMPVSPEKYNIEKIIEELKGREKLKFESLKQLLTETSSILKNEPTLLRLESSFVIVGDVHGQFYDLLNIFNRFGFPPFTKYLFLGDYVDRGRFCVEVISLLMALKVNYPSSVYLLRGNHEGRVMTTAYNFKTECQIKYNSWVYERFMDLFMCLPLCAIIDKRYFAVHGGISPKLDKIGELDKIDRFCEIGQSGVICDLLWSDPIDQFNDNWKNNDNRSCSYFYSQRQSERFLKNNALGLIIRGHEVQLQGFKYQLGTHNQSLTLTVFSAPRYCDTYHNKGAVAILNKRCLSLQTFRQVEHPFVMSNYQNAVSLSFPLLAAEITKIFSYILKNKRIRSNIKVVAKAKDSQIRNAIDEVDSIEEVLNKHASDLRYILKSSSETASDLKNTNESISESLMMLFQKECLAANQKCPSAIFGPRQLPFVKVNVSRSMEEDDLIEGQ